MLQDPSASDTASSPIRAPAANGEPSEPGQKTLRSRSIWRRVRLWAKRAFAFSTTISAALLAIWIMWQVGNATVQTHDLDIDSIEVPKRLIDDGFSAKVVTRRLLDAVNEILEQAHKTTSMLGSRVDLHHDISDISIPKAGISAESLAASIRRVLPDSWRHEVSGEVVVSGGELSIRLRLNSKVVVNDTSTDLSAVEALIDKAGFKLVESTQPFIAAAFLYGTGDLLGAARLADKVIDSLPSSDEQVFRSYNLKGNIARDQHDRENAIAFYLKYPNSALTRYNLGLLYDDEHNIKEAINNYRRAIQLDPQYPAAHINLGIALLDQGKIDEAISQYPSPGKTGSRNVLDLRLPSS